MLCREVIRRNYGSLGSLRTRKQQPGVEFHLRLDDPTPALGEVGRHWGWQCRWYEPDAFYKDKSRLRKDQRNKIEEAIEKSAEHVEGLSDWVLWTREKLSAEDERWFDELQAPFTLHHWDEETLEGLLSGPAEILLKTWFGELVLDDPTLVARRRQALAPIEHRYIEELHVRTPPERSLWNVLAGPELASRLTDQLARLQRVDVSRRSPNEPSDATQAELATRATDAVGAAKDRLKNLLGILESGRLPEAIEVRAAAGEEGLEEALFEEIRQLDPRQPAAWGFGQAERSLQNIRAFLLRLAEGLELPMLVLAGSAGAGKTHLAAYLTGPDEAPRGLLVLGRQFAAKISDADFARFSNLGDSLEQLLESLEALGAREGRRIPLVIDGINESDDPRAWRDFLPRLRVQLEELRHVVAFVTVRPSYMEMALPQGTRWIDLAGFMGVEELAVDRYFDFYKIRADATTLDWWRPSDPLLLSIFCRTINPIRERTIEAAELPGSMTEVFENYLHELFNRVAITMDMTLEEVDDRALMLAREFFETGGRHLERAAVETALGDRDRGWRNSLRFQLENEELLSREVVDGDERVVWSYDLMAGHLIAKSLLADHDPKEIATDPLGSKILSHPLEEDIVSGIAGLLGRRGEEPSTIFTVTSPLAHQTALASVRLPAASLGDATLAGIAAAFHESPPEVLEAISALSLRSGHPLNAKVLDLLLGDLTVWERDLIWSEWVRHNADVIGARIGQLEQQWKEGEASEDNGATLAWLTWLLTSTSKPLRDRAIRALYYLGRVDPAALFARAIKFLGSNDSAISDGLLAAAYGVAMAAQGPDSPALPTVVAFARELKSRLLEESASEPTWHWLIREYAYRIVQLAGWLSNGELEAPTAAAQIPLPGPDEEVKCFEPKGPDWESVEGAFRMDFANYTIGRLAEGRSNYDFDDPNFKQITGEIRARVAGLGWTADRFGEIDNEIAESSFDGAKTTPNKVERYGKKYSWIGFYEAAGRLSDAGRLYAKAVTHEGWRISDMPIDPSFPQTKEMPPSELPEWVVEGGKDEEWARHGEIEIPDRLLRFRAEDGATWIATDGYLRQNPRESQRKVFCFIRGLLACKGWNSVEIYLNDNPIMPELVPDGPTDYYCFAGESPWSPTFDSWATTADGTFTPQTTQLGWREEDGPEVELLAVGFGWESYHSMLNDADVGSLPSKAFAHFVGLRKLPDFAEFVDSDGQLAAKSLALTDPGWHGHVLYIREDLLEAYCAERGGEWGWIVWGEREVFYSDKSLEGQPAWLGEVRRQGLDRFNRVASLPHLQQPAHDGEQ